jgi:iron complex transport system ATP-binding protein
MVKCLTAEHLNLWVGARQLINDVSVTLEAGELVALIGPMAREIDTAAPADRVFGCQRGPCCLDGRPLHDWPPEVLSATGR